MPEITKRRYISAYLIGGFREFHESHAANALEAAMTNVTNDLSPCHYASA